ncbi:hypothetical protein ISS04_02695 [Candidatus Woesearchaeota archaeon]|nr:hypothetical protein [Candidatus Woesearchaeota archaeon]
MSLCSIKVGDVNININISTEKLKKSIDLENITKEFCKYFQTTNEKPQTELILDMGYPYYHKEHPSLKNHKLNFPIIHDQIELLELSSALGYLAGQYSKKYSFCHAAGIQKNNKGALFIGKPHSGKSKLSNILADVILDDDIILASRNSMKTITKNGFKTNKNKEYRIEIENSPEEARLDYVFLLNKERSSTHIRQIPPSQISKTDAFEHNLGLYLLMNYKGAPDFNIPVFEVGTKDFKHNTKNIERILS